MAVDTKFAISVLSNVKVEEKMKPIEEKPEKIEEPVEVKEPEALVKPEALQEEPKPTPSPLPAPLEKKLPVAPKPTPIKQEPKKDLQKEKMKKQAEEKARKEAERKRELEEKARAQHEIDMKTIIQEASYTDSSLNNQNPRYPIISKKEGEEGEVILLVKVSASGMPIDIVIYKSSGFERLDNASMYAVKNWRFIPAKNKLNMPVESVIKISFLFNLTNESSSIK